MAASHEGCDQQERIVLQQSSHDASLRNGSVLTLSRPERTHIYMYGARRSFDILQRKTTLAVASQRGGAFGRADGRSPEPGAVRLRRIGGRIVADAGAPRIARAYPRVGLKPGLQRSRRSGFSPTGS